MTGWTETGSPALGLAPGELGREDPGRGSSDPEIKLSHEYKHRGRNSSRSSDLQFWAAREGQSEGWSGTRQPAND
jgi:hypothetical protein